MTGVASVMDGFLQLHERGLFAFVVCFIIIIVDLAHYR